VLFLFHFFQHAKWSGPRTLIRSRISPTIASLGTAGLKHGSPNFCRGPHKLLQCFFKVFERVSLWSFRVSTPFSLLCLILLTYFHKNTSFRPNMPNYLNTTFTFGKQTKDNFINRKVQCRSTHSFTHSFAHSRACFFFGESHGGSSPRRTRNISRSTAISDSSARPTSRRYQARSET